MGFEGSQTTHFNGLHTFTQTSLKIIPSAAAYRLLSIAHSAAWPSSAYHVLQSGAPFYIQVLALATWVWSSDTPPSPLKPLKTLPSTSLPSLSAQLRKYSVILSTPL